MLALALLYSWVEDKHEKDVNMKVLILTILMTGQLTYGFGTNVTVINEDVKQQMINMIHGHINNCIYQGTNPCVLKMQNADLATTALDFVNLSLKTDFQYIKGEIKMDLSQDIKCFSQLRDDLQFDMSPISSRGKKRYSVYDNEILKVCRGWEIRSDDFDYDQPDYSFSKKGAEKMILLQQKLDTLKSKGYEVVYERSKKDNVAESCSQGFFGTSCHYGVDRLITYYKIRKK